MHVYFSASVHGSQGFGCPGCGGIDKLYLKFSLLKRNYFLTYKVISQAPFLLL